MKKQANRIHLKPFQPRIRLKIRLGILGGGQLAQMLASSATPLGLEPHILSTSNFDPAAQVTAYWHSGNPNNSKDLKNFLTHHLNAHDLLTFESEFVNTDNLIQLNLNFEEKNRILIFPKPHLMKLFQFRSSQKSILEKFKIPTAPFMIVKNHADLNKAWEKFNGNFVLKKNFGGYDGYGTHCVRSLAELKKADKLFINSTSDDLFIAEAFIAFQKELAVVFVRSANGSCIHLPLVESHQTQHRCDWVQGPIQHKKFPELKKQVLNMLKKLDYVGCIAFELFDTGKDLLINEIAPRVHNSGHYSQDALLHSQFDLHLMAGLGYELPKPQKTNKVFAMVNLLGKTKKSIKIPQELTGKLHLYGKKENRPGRKMGHINYLGTNLKETLKRALIERKKFQL